MRLKVDSAVIMLRKGGGNTDNDFKYAKSHILPPNMSKTKILNHRVADENMIK